MGGCIYMVCINWALFYRLTYSSSDQRNIPALDRIGDSEDIIASIFVENGVVSSISRIAI